MTVSRSIENPLEATPTKEIVNGRDKLVVMSLLSEISSRDTLRPLTATEDRRRTGRYVAGGTALAVILLALHHILLRGAPTVAGICIPTIIMASYVLWVLYSARRDRRKARLLASAMQLTEVITAPRASSIADETDATRTRDDAIVTRDPGKHIT
ncbi:uncharacterized protein [Venturia canescens]|uniref:uncharacterized protein n=1 Tax=Venturia canescens TaxID=32260 RepID=UPI001C9CDA8F|nr:uncharacterized protein LOC122414516 [Venturia canescens]